MRFPRLAGNALLLLMSLGITAVIAEIGLRVLRISYPYFSQVDAVTGFSLRPGAQGWNPDEGEAWVHINRFGMNDHDRSIPKPADTFRIAVLGDSFTEARQVDRDETYAAVLEKELQNCPALAGKKIEALNFGVSGFGLPQELALLKDRVWQFEPDLLLLGFYTGNDVFNSSFAMEKNKQKPYLRSQSGQIVFDNSFRDTSFFRSQSSVKSRLFLSLINQSRVLQLLNRTRMILRDQNKQAPVEGITVGNEPGLDSAVYADPPPSPEWEEAWHLTEEALRLIRDEADAHGVPFLLTVIARAIEIHPDPAVRKEYLQEQQVSDFTYPERRLTELKERMGIPVLSLRAAMLKAAEKDQRYFHGFSNIALGIGHWNEEGHQFGGERMAQFICETIRR